MIDKNDKKEIHEKVRYDKNQRVTSKNAGRRQVLKETPRKRGTSRREKRNKEMIKKAKYTATETKQQRNKKTETMKKKDQEKENNSNNNTKRTRERREEKRERDEPRHNKPTTSYPRGVTTVC